MADDRTLSLGTKFTSNISSLKRGIGIIRKEMDKLNATMGKQAAAVGGAKGTSKHLQSLEKNYSRLGGVLGNFSDRSKTWQEAFKRLSTSLGGKETVATTKELGTALDKTQSSIARQVNSLRAAGKEYRGLLTATNLYNRTQQELDRRGKQAVARLDSMNASTKKVYDSTNLFNRQLSRISGGMERLKAAFKVTAAYGIAATAIFSVVNALKAGIKEIVDYDQALKNLQAITRASDAEVRAMGKAIKEVATRTKFSTTEVADAMVVLGQAGFSASEAIEAIGAVADLSTGTLVDMAVAADLLTTIIRAFGKEAFQASEIADIMANAINRSKLTIDKLRIAFNYVGPSADATGTSLEEVSAAMMALANSGLRASTIGTGLRQILARLAAPSAKLREKMEANGIAVEDLDIKVHGFSGVLENLKDVFYDVEKGTMEARLGFELFGLRGANAILALIKAIETGDYEQYLKYVYEVGTAAAMAATQIEGLALKFKNLSDRAKLLAVELGENGVAGVIGMVLDSMKALVNVITAFVQTTAGKLITILLLIKTSMYTIVTAGALIASFFKWLVTFMGTKAGAIMGGFWGRLIFVVLGTVAVFKTFTKSARETKAELEDQRIELIRNADQLEFYQKALKEARKEMEENSQSTYKYNAVVERLKKSFPKLADAIEAVRDDIDALNKLLEQNKLAGFEEAAQGAIKEFEALKDMIESEQLKAGWIEIGWKVFKGWMTDVEIMAGHFKKLIPGTELDKSIGRVVNKSEELGGILKWISESYKELNDNVRELGDTQEQVTANTAQYKLMAGILSGILARTYKDQKVTLKEIGNILRGTLGQTEMSAEQIIQVVNMTIDKVEELRRIAQMPFKMGDIDTVFKQIWDAATAAQKDGIRKRQKQLDTELSSFKKFAETHKEIVKDKEAVIASIVLKAHLEMLELMDKEELVEWAVYAQKIERYKKLGGIEISYIKKIAREEQKALRDKLSRAKGNQNREDYIKDKMTRLAKQRSAQIAAYEEQVGLKTIEFTKEMDRSKNEYLVEEAAKTADRIYSAYEREQEEAVLLGKKKAERADVEVAEEAYAIARKKYNNLVKLLEEYYIIYEYHTEKRKELDEKIRDAWEDMENARINVLGTTTKEHEVLLKKQLRHIEGYYRAGWVSAKEYYDKIKEAEGLGIITDPEVLKEFKILLTGSMWDNFIRGVDKAKQGLDSWNQVLMDLGENFADVFSDNIIDAFDDMIEGSKSAGEAFADMAKDTIKWITKMLMKAMLMKAITGMFPSLGPALAVAGGGGGGSSAAVAASIEHKGGVVGEPAPIRFVDPYVFANAKRYHSGLASDEVPVILQKGETVLPKGQGINLQVEVINETGIPMQGDQGETRFDGERYVTDIHLSKLMTNRSYRQAHRRL